MVLNKFSDASYGIGHRSDASCPCNPRVVREYTARSSGRGGSHQGYRTTLTLEHNPLTK